MTNIKDSDMKISLEQAELETAVRDYVAAMGIQSAVTNIQFSSTRNPPGFMAEVDISRIQEPATSTVNKPQDSSNDEVEHVAATPSAEENDSEAETEAFEAPEIADEEDENTSLFG